MNSSVYSARCSLARVYQPGDILRRVETLKERAQRKKGSGSPRGMQPLSLSLSLSCSLSLALSFSASSRYSVNTKQSETLCHLFCTYVQFEIGIMREMRGTRDTRQEHPARGNIPSTPFDYQPAYEREWRLTSQECSTKIYPPLVRAGFRKYSAWIFCDFTDQSVQLVESRTQRQRRR